MSFYNTLESFSFWNSLDINCFSCSKYISFYFISNIVTNFFYTPTDGDIIVISHGAEYADPIIKRVIATEGQKLSIDFDKGEVFVDGKKLDEPYIQGFTHAEDAEIPEVIPEGKVFVMGDNRGVSLDSRSKEIGLIDVKDIIGKAQVVVFPFNSIKYLYWLKTRILMWVFIE